MLKIGLTGGIASGKSVDTQYLRELGAPVFDADAASRQAVAKGMPGLQQVLQVHFVMEQFVEQQFQFFRWF